MTEFQLEHDQIFLQGQTLTMEHDQKLNLQYIISVIRF